MVDKVNRILDVTDPAFNVIYAMVVGYVWKKNIWKHMKRNKPNQTKQ